MKTPLRTRPVLSTRIAPAALAFISLAASALAQNATGDFSAAFLGVGNIDTQVGLNAGKDYYAAYNLGSANPVTVNGVTFTGVGGVNPTVAGKFVTSGMGTLFGSGGPNPGGQLGLLTTDFVYGAGTTAEILTINGLTIGDSYVVSFYNSSWEAAATGRRQTMSASGASLVTAGAFTFDEDIGATAQGQFNVLRYTFFATTAQQLINFVAQVSGTTMHQYGFTVERTFNNTYTGGADWTAAAWGAAGTPNAQGRSAAFAAAGAPSAINLDANVTVGHLQFDGANAWTVSSATGRTLTMQADVGGTSTLSAKAGSHVVNPNITLSNGLLKVGAGQVTLNGNITAGASTIHVAAGALTLNGTNTYTGETIINGTLEVNTLSDYGVASSIGTRTFAQENAASVTGIGLHFQNGTLRFTGSTPQSTNRHIRILNGAAAATLDASGTTPAATMSFTRTGAPINLFDTGGVRTLTLTGPNTGDNTLSLQIVNQAANATSLTKTGAGTWVLAGPDTNTATGATTVSNGMLKLAKTNAIAVSGALNIGNASTLGIVQLGGTGGNQIADASIATLTGTGATAGTLRLNGLNETIGGLASAGGAGIVENESGIAGTSTLTTNVTGTQTFSGVLRDGDGAGTDGTLALTKIGAGTQILTGANTYTGATTVNAGVLTVNGSLAAGSAVGVTGATLNGTGTIGGAVTLNANGILGGLGTYTGTVNMGVGSRVSPATATTAGTLAINALSFGTGSFIDLEFGGTNDLVNITGASGLALNGGSVNLFAAGGVTPLTANGTYTLLDYNTGYTGPLTNISVANSQAGKLYTIIDDTVGTQITLNIADATTTEWNGVAADGQWGTDGNWTALQPNATGTVARFGTIPATPTAIAVTGGKTAGNLIFDNANAYTLSGSAITLDNGFAAAVVAVNSGSHSIANALVLSNNTNVNTAAGTTLGIGGNISGAKALNKLGAGTLILTGANSHTLTNVNAGTLQIGADGTIGTLGTGDVNVLPGATLAFNRSDDITIANNIIGGGIVTKNDANILSFTGTNAIGTLNINAGTVNAGSAGALGNAALVISAATLDLNDFSPAASSLAGTGATITSNGASPGTSTLTVNQAGNTTFDGTITDGPERLIALTKTGAGILTLAGNTTNSYYGGTAVTGGTLRLQKSAGNAVVSDITIGDANGSDILELGAVDQIGDASVVTLTAGGSGNSAFFRINGFNDTIKGLQTTVGNAAVLENNSTTAGNIATLTVDTAGGNFTYDGIIRNASAGTSVFALTKTGPGTLTLANTVAVGVDSYTGATTITDGKLVLSNLSGFGATPIAINSAVPGALTVNTTTRDLTTAAPLSGTGEFVKNGDFTLTLTGVGSQTAASKTIVNAGTMGLGNNGVLGSSEIVMNGGIIRAVSAGRILSNAVTVNGSFTLGRLTDLLGPITLNADATISANNFDGPANNPSNLGPIGGVGRIGFAEGPQLIGTGSLNVTGVNTNSGGTTIASGRVNVTTTGALANAPLTVNGGELNFANAAQIVASLSGGGGTMNLGAGNTLTVEQAGDSVFAGGIGGTGALVKNGAGTLTLSGTSSLTGTTTVNSDILQVNGSISGSAVTVNAGGTLAGVGTTGPVNSIGGIIEPGSDNTGTLTTGAMTLDSNSIWSFQLDTPGIIGSSVNDLLVVNGALTLDGTLYVTSFFGFGSGIYRLANYTGALTDNGLELTTAFLTAYPGSSVNVSAAGEVNLNVVPEPGSAVLLLGGLAMLASRRRRQA